MKYKNKLISELTDEELNTASLDLAKVLADVEEKRKSPKFIAKFKNQPLPTINPYFTELKNTVDEELEKRKF